MSSETVFTQLGDVINIHDHARIPLSSMERMEMQGDYPYYGATSVMDYVDSFIFSGLHLLLAEDGSVLNEDGTPVLQLVDGDFWVNNHAHVLTGSDDVDTRFAYYALSIAYAAPWVTGAVQLKINQRWMKRIEINYPNRERRESIVEYLNKFDDLMDNKMAMIEKTEKLISRLFRSWFIDFDPVKSKLERRLPHGMDEETAALFSDTFVETEHGLIPSGWKWGKLGDCISIVGGATPSTKNNEFWDGPYNWTSPKDLSGSESVILLDTEKTITEAGLAKISSGLLPENTVLMSSRAPIGYVALTKIPVAINQGYIAILPEGTMSPNFMLSWINFNMRLIEAYSSGSTFPEISKREFRKLPILIPPAELIEKFNEKTNRLYEFMETCLKQMNSLRSIRDAVLPKLMSGEIGV